ncbi:MULTISPECIES: hypothetical protein [Hydrocarboniphaga]|uniref:Uncharacterized protein n=1 Tax=Hydrocarboniphaga effusa AP103 TaxID=1172194 RepID=I8TA40_9GAMM|nr:MULTISPECIES: hypothetical protein [Hydrocarboniphaga]EIT70520.1 hypothetical protein WQQ_06570 [Hydrocarboniphaga effusa AP103]MDZ4077613.1 hypothetical protein [Hydrocarboniphaga sp.]
MPNLSDALQHHMERHGDTDHHLERVFAAQRLSINKSTIRMWRTGAKCPSDALSFRVLKQLEDRYRLADGYFRKKVPNSGRANGNLRLAGISSAERRRLAWHLPEDFDRLPRTRREEILDWVRTVIISGSTEYRRYQAAAMRHRYAIKFDLSKPKKPDLGGVGAVAIADEDGCDDEVVNRVTEAPAQLNREIAELVEFKTATLTRLGMQRSGVWGSETVQQKIEHLGLMMGGLVASPRSAVAGLGVEREKLTMALLALPSVWDWYLRWREAKRGFYTLWEIDMLMLAGALTRRETGWLRQSPHLASRLRPIDGLVSHEDIEVAREDWDAACDRAQTHALRRSKEIERVARVHRDPFEPVLAVLESDSPLGTYRQIADEILARQPDERRYPVPAAESCRAFLMLRFGMHLGLRQKNLRQLLLCPRGQAASSERKLELLRRGEIRWSERDGGWEVLVPAVAFKNADSSYFGKQPYRLILPDIGELYKQIDAYTANHRRKLLGDVLDPGTFFVKTTKRSSREAEYDQNTFYEAWRLAIQRYGIFNPYTGRGAIKGLLPHGPHNVRDVLATHILKKTGSYEQASYAIQDTPETVAKHYGRFLPQDKAALAARVLNQVWSG